MKRGICLVAVGLMVATGYMAPAHAQFESARQKVENLNAERALNAKQAEDMAKIQAATQQSNAILGEILTELRKQTALLEAINAKQKTPDTASQVLPVPDRATPAMQ